MKGEPELFVTLEGCEGSGKTTQARLLERWFDGKGLPALFVRDPGSTRLGEALRDLLLSPAGTGTAAISPLAEALLYTAARSQLVSEVIVPALAQGSWVVCERYIDSTLAYQGYGLGLPVDELRRVNDFSTGGVWPALTVLFDLPAEVGLQRARRRQDGPDRIESRGIAYHERVAEGYRALARGEPDRFRVIDGRLRTDEIHREVVREIERLLAGGMGQ